MSQKWYAIYTRPRWEKKVHNLLVQKGIESYCPLNKVHRKWSDRIKLIEEPLFKSYVFVRASDDLRSEVRMTDGVINFVYWDGKPAVIKEKEIQAIRRFLDEHQDVELVKVDWKTDAKVAVLAAGLTVCSQAGFVAPGEGPVAFRRDRLPLDTTMLAELSKQLTELAYALTPTTAAEWRGAAQMLAVATAVDPANTRARTLIDDFVKNRRRPGAEEEPLVKYRAKVREYISWLETPEAGPDGQALAACLKDVLVFSDPADPQAEASLAAGQQGAWKDWIPPQAYYEDATGGSATAAAGKSTGDPAGGAPGAVGLRE
ncbi:MAG: UpxY family transcription antiterminator, partial [Chitinophagaceae bacterium]